MHELMHGWIIENIKWMNESMNWVMNEFMNTGIAYMTESLNESLYRGKHECITEWTTNHMYE